jgi:hypothetical protein
MVAVALAYGLAPFIEQLSKIRKVLGVLRCGMAAVDALLQLFLESGIELQSSVV